jgi:hypothetical protein
MARHDSNTIIKFADDTTVVGLITDNNETAYREEVRDLTVWCKNNNLSINMIKTKEIIVDYRKRKTVHAPILFDGAVLEQVESFKFLGVYITNKLTWSKHTMTVVNRAGTTKPIPPQETEKIWHGSSDPQTVLQLQHRGLHQLVCLRPQGTTEGSAYGPVHHWGQASFHPGPLYQAVSEEGLNNCQRLQPPQS